MLINFWRIFLITLLSIFSGIAYAQVDIKLSCQLSVSTIYFNGTREQDIKNVVFDVFENNRFLSIISTHGDFGSVSTKNYPHTLRITNFSNENRWDLTVDTNISSTKIIIDRNSGQIFYSHNFNEGRIYTQANGICNKIDTKIKKF
jgi:hypothetical protein